MAGTVTEQPVRRKYRSFRGYTFDFTADAGDGSFPHALIPDTGLLAGATVIFGDPVPTGIDLVIADQDGVDRLGGDGAGFTDTGKVTCGPPETFIDGLVVALDGNTAGNAKVRVVVYVI